MFKSIAVLALAASASAFSPLAKQSFSTKLNVDPNPTPQDGAQAQEMGWSMGGEAHTRDPTPTENEDPRKTIPEGESFEEYMKRREGAAPAAGGGDGRYGKYDDKLWDNEAKKDVYNM